MDTNHGNAMNQTIFDLSGKTALVIGASSGIGQRFSQCLSHAGAKVLLSARRIDRLEILKKQMNNSYAYQVDVSDQKQINELISQIEKDGHKIDILVIAAGLNIRKSLFHYSFEDWRQVMNVNLDGVFLATQAVAKHMVERKIAGSIIQISSTLDSRTFAGSSQAYQASKAAVHQLTKSLALELAPHHIRVNCIAPGWFITDLNRQLFEGPHAQAFLDSIPMKRTGELTELDGALLLLASNASSYMTGSILRVDGGYATNHLQLNN